MRTIIFAAGSDGDIHPHLGLASELAARGHEVLFLTSFDYLDLARSCGIEARSIIDAREKDQFESRRTSAQSEKFDRAASGFAVRSP